METIHSVVERKRKSWRESRRQKRVRAVLVAVAIALSTPLLRANPSSNDEFFLRSIEPIFRAHCYRCHSANADEIAGGLQLDSPIGLATGGDSGPVINTEDAEDSLLVMAIRHEGGYEMPPDQDALPPSIAVDIVNWIRRGANDPRPHVPDALQNQQRRDRDVARAHWAFQPLSRPQVPSVQQSRWPRSPVDAFVLSKLEKLNWDPAPAADRTTWIRRVTFDLTGLPPTSEEVDHFLSDTAPLAFERVVDRLLSSYRFGERAAQHWLDVVRYAETEGFEYDRHLPGAWRYRDYVITAFNQDKPYDEFVLEQLAGDEIDDNDVNCLAASVFHRLGAVRRNAGNPDIALSRNEVLTERTNIIGEAFLGLTVGCARCHNHKLEPISQRDYYQLQSYVAATEEFDKLLIPDKQRTEYETTIQRIDKQTKQLRKSLENATPQESKKIAQDLMRLQKQRPQPPPTIPSVRNNLSERTEIHVLRRGVWEHKGVGVSPRPPHALVSEEYPALPPDAAKPRSALADWLTEGAHPLTARVIVNRIWQSHFGTGIVATANDFGTHGAPPSHPLLLDWLAAELVNHQWQLKRLHRLIVLSSTYRMSCSSPITSKCESTDPRNQYLWRFDRRRLSAEEIRDAMLASSGMLNHRIGGESVMVPVDTELTKLLYKPDQWVVTANESEHYRRSIYLLAKRNLRLPFFEAFDAPTLQTSCPNRQASTHGLQALELLNGSFSNQIAMRFASRLEAESLGKPQAIVRNAFQIALGRPPNEREERISIEFLAEQTTTEFALAIFNLNGFCYVD